MKDMKDTERRRPLPDAEADGVIEGRNAVIEALRVGTAIDKIYIAKGETDKTLGHIASRARDAGIVVVEADRRKLDAMSLTHAHQGVIAVAAGREPADLVLTMQEVTDRQGAPEAPPIRAFDEIVKREPYPVETKAKEILRRLRGVGITRFLLLFRGSKTRSELVATFMAVLELCRNNLIKLAGAASDCTVTAEGDAPEELM